MTAAAHSCVGCSSNDTIDSTRDEQVGGAANAATNAIVTVLLAARRPSHGESLALLQLSIQLALPALLTPMQRTSPPILRLPSLHLALSMHLTLWWSLSLSLLLLYY